MSAVTAMENKKENLYETYENLLLKRDQLEREAGSLHSGYLKMFGELITAIFEEKVACIKIKKQIAFYQTALNRGMHVNQEELERVIEKEMTMYYRDLKQMMVSYEAAKKSESVGDVVVYRCKKLYKRIAKRIHPDINPWTTGKMELLDLWNRTVSAYHALNVKELGELEVLANNAMEKLGLDTFEIEIPDLEDKIECLEKEINEILTTEPYTYERILSDEAACKEKREALQRELDDYHAYKAELDDALRKMMVFDGVSALWGGQPG